MRKTPAAFSLIELLVALGVTLTLGALAAGAGLKAYASSSLAVSANNVRQLAAGTAAYLADHDQRFWKYRENLPGGGVKWWFGTEEAASLRAGEGNRTFRPEEGPLAGYIPAGVKPDPSFSVAGKAFKPKYRSGYIGVGYNVLLAYEEFAQRGNSRAAWTGGGTPVNYWHLENPSRTVVFATSAQVNNFQRPASPKNPMIEEFYGIDESQATVHGRHGGQAMVAFADGNAGFLPIDPATADPRSPEARIGRFAPAGDVRYLR